MSMNAVGIDVSKGSTHEASGSPPAGPPPENSTPGRTR